MEDIAAAISTDLGRQIDTPGIRAEDDMRRLCRSYLDLALDCVKARMFVELDPSPADLEQDQAVNFIDEHVDMPFGFMLKQFAIFATKAIPPKTAFGVFLLPKARRNHMQASQIITLIAAGLTMFGYRSFYHFWPITTP